MPLVHNEEAMGLEQSQREGFSAKAIEAKFRKEVALARAEKKAVKGRAPWPKIRLKR